MTPPAAPPRSLLMPRAIAGIVLALLAALSYAAAGFIASQLVGEYAGGTGIALLESVFGLVFVLALHLGTRRRGTSSPAAGSLWKGMPLVWLVLAATFSAMGVGAFYSALTYEGLSVVAPVAGFVPLVSYAFILVLMRGEERLTGRVIVGALLVVIGVVLIGLTN